MREANSSEAIELAMASGTPILFTALQECELWNALHLKRRRQEITERQLHASLGLIRGNLEAGHLQRPDVEWPGVWRTCRNLSEKYTVASGCRTLDALHVALALSLKSRDFVSFDVRQRDLARRVGLRLRPRV